MGTTQSRGFGPTPKFLSVSDEDMEKMIGRSLEAQQLRAKWIQTSLTTIESFEAVEAIGKEVETSIEIVEAMGVVAGLFLPHYTIAINSVKLLLIFLDNKESIQEKMFDQKISREQIKFAMNILRSDMGTIENRVNRIQDENIPIEDRKREVVPAFVCCEKVIRDFENSSYPFYSNPLITAPCLITFAQLYLSIILIGVYLIPTYAEHANREKQRLKEVLEDYKKNTINERLKMVRIVQTIKTPNANEVRDGMTRAYKADDSYKLIRDIRGMNFLHDIDIVVDDFGYQSKKKDEWHYWDRALQQGSMRNKPYTSVVSNVYEEFFDKVIKFTEV